MEERRFVSQSIDRSQEKLVRLHDACETKNILKVYSFDDSLDYSRLCAIFSNVGSRTLEIVQQHFEEDRTESFTEALEFTQTKLTSFGKVLKFGEKLEDFMALLAYEKLEKSPMFHLLSSEYRQHVLDNLNQAILAAFNQGKNNMVFVFYKQAVATIFLVSIAIIFERKRSLSLSLVAFCKIFMLSLFGIAASLNLYGIALVYTSTTLAAATSNTLPVITFFLAVPLSFTLFWLLIKRLLARRKCFNGGN